MPSKTASSLKLAHQAQRLSLMSSPDAVRKSFNLSYADALQEDALTILTPAHPLQVRQGEVIDAERPGLTDFCLSSRI